jgi:hypothetical protein
MVKTLKNDTIVLSKAQFNKLALKEDLKQFYNKTKVDDKFTDLMHYIQTDLVTKEDLKIELKLFEARMDEKFVTKQEFYAFRHEVLTILDKIMKKLDDISFELMSNQAAPERFERKFAQLGV